MVQTRKALQNETGYMPHTNITSYQEEPRRKKHQVMLVASVVKISSFLILHSLIPFVKIAILFLAVCVFVET